MARFLTFLSVLICGALITGQAFSQVKFSENALENLKKFENQRGKFCAERITTPLPVKVPSNANLDFNFQIDPWPRYNYLVMLGGKACPIDLSISYLKHGVEQVCPTGFDQEPQICKRYEQFHNSPTDEDRFLFVENFETLLEREEYYPWQLISAKNGPADKVDVTLIQKGNISLKVTLNLTSTPLQRLTGYSGKKIKSQTKKLGINIIREDLFYYPTARFDILIGGVAENKLRFRLYRVFTSGSGKLIEKAIYGTDLKNDQLISLVINFFKVAKKRF